MNDISAIRVLFYRKERRMVEMGYKLLSKSRRSGIKDIILDKFTIPKTNEETNEKQMK
jgi:hypothetical protein